MKAFTKNIAGYTVTESNYKEIAKIISDKHGVCPALNDIVMTCVQYSCYKVSNKKELTEVVALFIKEIGYTRNYFNAQLRALGPEY